MTAITARLQEKPSMKEEEKSLCTIGGDLLRMLILYTILLILCSLGFAYYFTGSLCLLIILGVLMISFFISLPFLIRFFIAIEDSNLICRLTPRSQKTTRLSAPIYTIPSEFIV